TSRRFRRPSGSEKNPGVINALHVDSHNTLWVAKRQGLFRIATEPMGDSAANLEPVAGMTNLVSNILVDSGGAIWLAEELAGGKRQLSRMSGGARQHFTMATTEGGLPSDWTFCFGESREGQIYVGTDAGLAVFDGTNFLTLRGTPDHPIPAGMTFSI